MNLFEAVIAIQISGQHLADCTRLLKNQVVSDCVAMQFPGLDGDYKVIPHLRAEVEKKVAALSNALDQDLHRDVDLDPALGDLVQIVADASLNLVLGLVSITEGLSQDVPELQSEIDFSKFFPE